MPKTILEFNLPEESEELQYAQKGIDYYLALFDFSQELRKLDKYSDLSGVTADQLLERIRGDFYRILEDRDVSV